MISKYKLLRNTTYLLLFLVLFIFSIIQARGFLYPIALAVLFAYLLYPLGHLLERKGMPRILSNFICLILLAAVVTGLLYFISSQIGNLTSNWEDMKRHAIENINRMENAVGEPLQEIIAPGPDQASDVLLTYIEEGGLALKTLFTATTDTLTKMALLPVYIFLLLYYRDKLYEFVVEVVPERYEDRSRNIMRMVSYMMRNYIGGLFVVVLILCVVNSAGLYIIGLKYAVLFGVISALMNFIPYFGTLIGGAIALLAALLLHGNPNVALGVLIFFVVVQFVENNILTPTITGGYVKINPLFTIVGIVMGGMVWGVPGMFVIVPFFAVMKILFDHTRSFKAFGYLMGREGTDKHAFTLTKFKGLFKRSS